MRTLLSTVVAILVMGLSPSLAQQDTLSWLNQLSTSKESVDTLQRFINVTRKTNHELATQQAKRSIKMSQSIGYQMGIAKGLNILGTCYMNAGLYKKAIDNYFNSLRIMDELGEEQGAAVIAANVAIIYDLLGQQKEAKKYNFRALKFFEENNHEKNVSVIQLNIGALYYFLEQYDSALYYFEKSLIHREKTNDQYGIAICNSNIGEVLGIQEQYKESITRFNIAQQNVDSENLLMSPIYLGLGRAYTELGQYSKGKAYLDSALDFSAATKQKDKIQSAYNHLASYYVKTGDYKTAYDYLDKEYELDIELRGEDVQSQIEVVNLSYENEKKERELAEAEARRAEEKLAKWIAISGTIGTILICGLIISGLRIRVHKSKVARQKLEFELNQKRKELTSYALNFIQKNELMDELTTKVNELRRNSDTDTALGLNRINHMISDSFRIDQDWENFKLMFEEVHPDFFVKLKEMFPDLGNAELKLSALLRLNMNLKESSKVLGISPDSVKTARYRLRKKLNLEHDQNLVDFFLKFDSELTPV